MDGRENPALMLQGLDRLHDEAMQRAAAMPVGSAEHDFYVGVVAAARDLRSPAHPDVSRPSQLAGRPPSFKDGYIKVADMVGAAAGRAPSRFPLPAFDMAGPTPG